MGFGSFDESEQENRETEITVEEDVETVGSEQDNEIKFNFEGTDTEELLEQYKNNQESH